MKEKLFLGGKFVQQFNALFFMTMYNKIDFMNTFVS